MRERVKNFFQSCEEYRISASLYGKRDLGIGLGIYLGILILYAVMGWIIAKRNSLTVTYDFVVTGIFSVVIISVIILCNHLQKKSCSDIGLSKKNLYPSVRCGLRASVVTAAVFLGIAFSLKYQFKTDQIQLIIINALYYLLFVAFLEELVFRGYLGTILYGVMKKKWLAILVTAILFSLFHIPFRMVYAKQDLLTFFSEAWGNLLFTVVFHMVLQIQYSKYRNLSASVIFHFLWDFLLWFAMNPV